MKISSILHDLLTRHAERTDVGDAAWADDPYAHPDIDAMSERERADLPPVHLPAPQPVLRSRTPFRVTQANLADCI